MRHFTVETFTVLLTYYNSVKHAARRNVKGAEVQYTELSKRFEMKKTKKATAKTGTLLLNQYV
jgi:hypothetical protein